MYSLGVHNDMVDLDPFASLEDVTQGLSTSLHFVATNSFAHTIVGNIPNVVDSHKLVGMMRNVMIQGDICNEN